MGLYVLVLLSQYNNPQETYNYYYLPFCAPPGAEKAKHKWGGLGEVLEGNELIDSQLEVKFRSASCPFFLPSRRLGVRRSSASNHICRVDYVPA